MWFFPRLTETTFRAIFYLEQVEVEEKEEVIIGEGRATNRREMAPSSPCSRLLPSRPCRVRNDMILTINQYIFKGDRVKIISEECKCKMIQCNDYLLS